MASTPTAYGAGPVHGSARVVKAARNAKLRQTLVVDAKGRTTYALTPETTRHLLCASAACLRFWPPVTGTRFVAGGDGRGFA